MVKETINHRIFNLKTTIPSHGKRRVIGRIKRTLGGGATSKISLGTTPMNVTQSNHWWLSSKKESRALTQTLIQKIIKGDRSFMYNPFLVL
jgi:hypothetical protein